MGKRVDFSARSVITPDPNLSLDELGVPLSIAMNLTFPEVVTPSNIYRMKELIENGPTEWPGAKFIIKDNGHRIDLRYLKKKNDIHLEKGYIVERHMQNGDLVLFNRQPSLHKMSIMGHKVRILPFSTFRLNLSVTSPYNADFDGDEMNLHLPQSLETKAEIAQIMHVPNQIISPQSNRPVMGIVQDSCVGIKMFTQKGTFVNREVLMNLLMWLPDFNGDIPIPAILKPESLWSGKQLISLILPKVNLLRFSAVHDSKYESVIHPADTRVIIEKGQLLSGTMCKKTVGTSGGGLIHIIWNEHGPIETMKFFNATQKLVNNWLLESGFTVGICDAIATEEVNLNIASTLNKAKVDVKDVLIEAQDGNLKCQPGKSMLETFEAKVNKILNEARDTVGKFVQNSLSSRNHIKEMVVAGSKGSYINLSQIIACVGQQNVEGKRIPFSFNRRTLPHFTKDDFGPESRGFVENSYLSGLTAQEFFFHAMGGREGLIDTAVKTSETGYIQRRLVKALEDVMVKYDGTVRNSNNQIIQFLYGEDGFGGEFIEDQKLESMMMNDKKLEKNYRLLNPQWTEEEAENFLRPHLEEDIIKEILYSDDSPEIKIRLDEEYENVKSDREKLRHEIFKGVFDDKQHFPVNVARMFSNSKKTFNISLKNKSDLSPMYIIEEVQKLKKRLVLVKGEDEISKEAQRNATLLIFINIGSHLNTKRLITERIRKVAFDWILGEIESRFLKSMACPGEMVGNIAAQSIGEPATQMTLNTFHFAGVSSKNVTLGVPRLKEVINVAKRLKTPSMTIYINENVKDQKETAKKLQTLLEHTSLMNLAINSKIYYDPDPRTTIIKEDEEMIEMHSSLNYLSDTSPEDILSPWLIRIELDGNILVDRNITMEDITEAIESTYTDIEVVASDLNAKQLVLRIRKKFNITKHDKKEDVFSEEATKSLENIIVKDTSLCGIPEIKKVYIKPSSKSVYNNKTGDLDKGAIEEWLIETDGNNLYEVFKIDEVDFTRTYSNDILEIYRILGIEAVRMALFKELINILKPYDIYVNFRHIATLCEGMTNRGYITSITRHGINRLDFGPMRKSTFEETVDILFEAGLYGETDNLKGISENIMVGQLAPLGTGSFDIFLNVNSLQDAKMIQDLEEIEEVDENEMGFENSIHTPIVAGTPIDHMRTVNYSATPNVIGNSPIWTDYQPNFGRTPTRNDNFIITPRYAPQDNILSSYVPNNDMHNPIYSPIIDMEESNFGNSTIRRTPNSPRVYSPYGIPDSQHGLTSRYQNITPTLDNNQSNQGYRSKYTPLSPSANNQYSPTTTPFQASQYSHPASGVYKPSNYSIGTSPRVQDSISSVNSNNIPAYTPNTPAYNPRSPGYKTVLASRSFLNRIQS